MNCIRCNLDPPPGFRPFDPRGELRVYHRRLPHWRQDGATYFVTFRLADSLPKEKIELLESLKREWAVEIAAKHGVEEACRKSVREEWSRTVLSTVESWLDRGMGECLLGNPRLRSVVTKTLDLDAGSDCEIGAGVVMPNHVHLLVRTFGKGAPERLLQRWKRRSALEINRLANRAGALWQEESFDRIVRDAGHLWRCLQYIGRNPSKAGLQDDAATRWVRQEWRDAGWDFVDEAG